MSVQGPRFISIVYDPISTKMKYPVTVSEHLWQYSDPIDRPSMRVSRPSNNIKSKKEKGGSACVIIGHSP